MFPYFEQFIRDECSVAMHFPLVIVCLLDIKLDYIPQFASIRDGIEGKKETI